MKRLLGTFVLLGAVSLATNGVVHAANPCVKDAHGVYKECKQSCRDDYVSARLVCRGVDPVCGTACVSARHACAAQVKQILETGQLPDGSTLANCSGGTDACDAALLQAKQACWAQYCSSGQTCTSCGQTADPTTCYECVDPAQATAFACRDACRDSFRQNDTVKAMKSLCKTTFRSCVAQCPPAP